MNRVPRIGEFRCPGCREILKVDAPTCPQCGSPFAVSSDVRSSSSRRLPDPWPWVALAGALLFTAAFADMGPDPISSSIPKITGLMNDIRTRHSEVSIDLGPAATPFDIVPNAASALEELGKAMRNGAGDIPPSIETISLTYTAELAEGGEGRWPQKILEFTVNADDLRSTNYDSAPAFSSLELARDINAKGKTDQDAMVAFCRDHSTTNPLFCGRRS